MRFSYFLVTAASLVCMTAITSAQTLERRASITGGDPDRGRCFVEIVVDGAAEVAIRGDDANITNLNGRLPELRRFECTRPLPRGAQDFRFRGIDGRGKQSLLRDPRDSGEAVVRIEDPQSGSDRYAFEITWRGGLGPETRDGDFGGRFGQGRRFTTDQAVSACQQNVRQQAAGRYRTNDVRFRQTNIDDQPGRSDWVVGTLEVRSPGAPDQVLKFSCSVDFGSGQIRSAEIQPFYSEGRGPETNRAAFENCRRAVGERVGRDGFGQLEFGDFRVDDRPGRSDWITGDFRAVGRYGPESFQFSCNVNLRDGDVRSVDVRTTRR